MNTFKFTWEINHTPCFKFYSSYCVEYTKPIYKYEE